MADRDVGTAAATRKGSLWLSKTKPGDVLFDSETGNFTSSRRKLSGAVENSELPDEGETAAAVNAADVPAADTTAEDEEVGVGDRNGGGEDDDGQTSPECDALASSESEPPAVLDGAGVGGAEQRATRWRSAEEPPASVAGRSIGAHLKDSHVFAVEVLSNRTIKAVIITYYVIFAALLAYDLSEYRNSQNQVALSIVPPPEAANESDPLLCVPNPQTQTCDPSPFSAPITSSEAGLLSNTILVSEGLNVSNWVGDHAKPGTPPFNAHAISYAAFLLNSSVLDYGANPDLHDVWDDLSGSIWLGSSRTAAWLEGETISRSTRSVGLSINFVRANGTAWPEETLANGTEMPLTIHAYACLKGQDCSSIGSYRGHLLPTPNAWVPEREPYRMNALLRLNEMRNILSAEFDIPNAMMVEGVLDSNAWRLALGADPGGAVSTCAAGEESCVVGIGLTSGGTNISFRVNAIVGLVALVCYLPYLIWWLVTVCKRLGTDVKIWPVEVFWLLFLGIGNLMFNGILITTISIHHLQPDTVFREQLWAAASIITQLGRVLQYFSLACFTDSPRRFVVSVRKFYGWKVLFCLVLWTSMFVTILYHYPLASGRDEPGTDLSIGGLGFVTTPETWPRNEKIVLSAFQLLWLTCTFFAIGYYFWVSQRTMKVFAELPYIMTRPVQLAFRFFRWSTLIWIVSEFVTLIVNLAYSGNTAYNYRAAAGGGLDAMVVTLNQMEIFEAHDSSLSKILFGTIFTATFLGFFLPLDPSASNAVVKSHYVTEEEAQKALESAEEVEVQESNGMKKFLLVLDRARLLCTCSRETYLPFDDEERRRDAKVAEEEKIRSGSTNFTDDDHRAIPVAGKDDTGAALKDALRKYLNEASAAAEESRPEEAAAAAPLQRKNSFFFPPRRRKKEGLGGLLERVDSWMPTEFYAKKGIDPHPWLEARIAGESVCWGERSPPGSTYAMGCRVVKRIHEPSYADMHDSRAVVFRHLPSNDLIVAFRGTKTKKQVKTDLMTQKVEVSLDRFLTIRGHRERMRRIFEGALPEELEQKMEEGTAGKVRILDLLHRDDDEHLPEFLKGRSAAGDGIRGTGQLHFGFFSSYSRLRKQVHATVYKELMDSPGRLLVCGHSLGGAQATACAYDMSRWIIPSLKKDLVCHRGKAAADKVTLCCYTYGAPRLGGPRFQAAFDMSVPETQRIINDGDVVTTTPPSWLGFHHVGTEDVFDYTGSLMADPSLIERKFGNKTRTYANSHKMLNYTKAIKRAYHPVMPIEDLLGMIRNAYGLDGELKESNHWESDS